MMLSKWRWILWLVVIALLVITLSQPSAMIFEALKSSHERWVGEVQKNWLFAASVFSVVAVAANATALTGVAITSLAAGALFGPIQGWVLAVASASIGATGAFLLSRLFLSDWVKRRFHEQWQVAEAGVRRDGVGYLILLRLIPLIPAVSINLTMGITSMSASRFFIVSFFGMMPGAAFFAVAGAKLSTLGSMGEVLTLGRVALLSVLGLSTWIALKLQQSPRS